MITLILFFFQAEDGIRDYKVTGVQTCALPISGRARHPEVPRPGARDDGQVSQQVGSDPGGSARASASEEPRDAGLLEAPEPAGDGRARDATASHDLGDGYSLGGQQDDPGAHPEPRQLRAALPTKLPVLGSGRLPDEAPRDICHPSHHSLEGGHREILERDFPVEARSTYGGQDKELE